MTHRIWRTRWWPLAAIVGAIIDGASYLILVGLAIYGAWRLIGG